MVGLILLVVDECPRSDKCLDALRNIGCLALQRRGCFCFSAILRVRIIFRSRAVSLIQQSELLWSLERRPLRLRIRQPGMERGSIVVGELHRVRHHDLREDVIDGRKDRRPTAEIL